MNSRIIRIGLAIIAALIFTLPIYWLIEVTHIVIAWIVIWCISFGLVVDTSNLLVRGFLFLIISVALGMIGVGYAKATSSDWLWAIEYLSQVMILVGSGVGANFIAHHFINRRKNV
ncbi:hypothetical protein QWY97_17780 [Vibrio cortegadensis]|uniref:hypothetical protein n=1 Tax=Vibrio cortegadensis TaxID=1328770 RepID=UPI0021C39476|nr:hypothetical protein [Vibrio cortegadensis]MDN3699177.1 hypothetical protein [Vibrio cortegadensis]